jgi:glutathione S-transferase
MPDCRQASQPRSDQEVVWDSLAIIDYLADKVGRDRFWPEDEAARAMARSMVGPLAAAVPVGVIERHDHLLEGNAGLPTGEPAAQAVVWDSLAIIDYLADKVGRDRFWPEDEAARAMAPRPPPRRECRTADRRASRAATRRNRPCYR